MQRFLSAVVLVSFGALLPAPAAAQTAAKPATSTEAEVSAAKKPDERLSDEAELARVAGLYEAGKYAECSAQVEVLLDPTAKAPLRQPAIVENARVYWAACLLGAGETEAAYAPLRAAIHENPQMKPPDSLVFAQPVVQLFLKVRDSLVNEIRTAEQIRIKQAQAEARRRSELMELDRNRMRELEKLAQQEYVVVRNRRVLACVPFGVGQLQNRQDALGYTLMAGEALLGGLSIAAVAVQSQIAAEADAQRRQGNVVDEENVNRLQSTWGTIRDVSFWAFAGLAVGGVVHAQLEFVPEFREVRKRPLPKSLSPASPAPSSSARPVDVSYVPYFEPRGGGLQVFGRF